MRHTTFMKTFLTFAALVLGVGTIASCSSSSSGNVTCSTQGHCAGEQAPTQTSLNQCNAFLNDMTCGAKFQALLNCAAANEKCAPDGGVDTNATNAACMSQNMAWGACVFSGLDGGLTD